MKNDFSSHLVQSGSHLERVFSNISIEESRFLFLLLPLFPLSLTFSLLVSFFYFLIIYLFGCAGS